MTTSGSVNSAWAEIGTRRSASTSGHTMGPPAENEYAVDPVGVARMTPSQPNAETGRESTPRTTSIIRDFEVFSTVASLSAQAE